MQPPSSLTAATLLQSLTSLASDRFSSNCPALDSLLTPPTCGHDPGIDTGLPRGAVLELIGPPGIGKSRTGMAFALAEAFKQDGGKVLIVDSEGSLNPALLYETAAFFATHNGYEEQQFVECTERLLHRRIDSTWLLIAFFHTLEDWLRDNAEVTLVIIDSLSSYLRPTLDLQTKKMLVDLIRSTLSSVCASRRVSFIVTTKMSIKLFGTDNRPSSWSRDAEAMLVPTTTSTDWLPSSDRAGEGVWRVLLYFDRQGERLARLLDAPIATSAQDVPFTMDAAGPYDHQALNEGCDMTP